jgi:hypothetical protein
MAYSRPSARWPWLVLLLGLVIAALFVVTRDPWPAEQGVAVPPGEAAQTARVVALAVAAANRAAAETGPSAKVARLAGAKAHGCVRARFTVPELEPGLRHGLFARAGEYDAWLRFSNAFPRSRSDQEADARGLAIKVLGVAGPKLLDSERDARTQDFVLFDTPRLFVRDVAELAELLAAYAHGGTPSFFLDGGAFRPWRWRLRSLWLAARMRRPPPASVLQHQYYSVTPYRLGPGQLVKYSARPCAWQRPPRQDRTEDMLRRGLRDGLVAEACFELLVQRQAPGRNTPVEDPTVGWSERDAPFEAVARITIPPQSFDSPEQDRFCEDLSFTPWHSLAEHEPVGGLNRVGRVVYQELSRYRHDRNGTTAGEPVGPCLDLTGATCPTSATLPATLASPPRSAPAPPGAPPQPVRSPGATTPAPATSTAAPSTTTTTSTTSTTTTTTTTTLPPPAEPPPAEPPAPPPR